MKKHILIASIIGGLSFAPVAVFAADNSMSNDHGSAMKMKGPPNADGPQQGRSDSETNAKAPTSNGDNGAASAKATGEAEGKAPK